jgi:hypothetical protein
MGMNYSRHGEDVFFERKKPQRGAFPKGTKSLG